VRTAIENGVNLIDTAESYGIPNGLSEIRLGKAIKGLRDKIKIVSKIGHWGLRTGLAIPKGTVDMIRECGFAICGRLRVDYVDAILCHEGNITEPDIYIEGLEALKAEGFICEYGISSDNLDVIRNFHKKSRGNCSIVEIDYSLLNKAPEKELLRWCQENNMGVLLRGPFHQGLLGGSCDLETEFTDTVRTKWNKGGKQRGDYEAKIAKVEEIKAMIGADANLAEVSLRYIISHPAAPVAIPGATKPGQVVQNVAASEYRLPRDLLDKLKVL